MENKDRIIKIFNKVSLLTALLSGTLGMMVASWSAYAPMFYIELYITIFFTLVPALNKTIGLKATFMIAYISLCSVFIFYGLILGADSQIHILIVFLFGLSLLIFQKKHEIITAGAYIAAILIFLEWAYAVRLVTPVEIEENNKRFIRWAIVFTGPTLTGAMMYYYFRDWVNYRVLAELRRANNLIKVFVARTTHDIRSPLNGVYVTAQIMKREIRKNESIKGIEHWVDLQITGCESIKGIINNVLDFTKIEAGELDAPYIESCDIKTYLKRIIDVHKILAKSRSIVIKAFIKDMPDFIETDTIKLNQILTNLLTNAIKYSDRNTTISIHITGDEGTWQIKIINYGKPIPEDKLPEIFSPFVTAQRGKESTGLGLYIVKEKITSMNGLVNVQSEMLATTGRTEFNVILPLKEGTRHEIHKDEDVDLSRLSPIKVLISEDNEINISVLTNILQNIGCISIITRNGQEALDAVLSDRPDVIILDLHMDVLDGLQTLKLLKASEYKNIPVIIATGDAFKETETQLLTAGACAVITKPYEVRSLEEKIWKFTQPLEECT